MDLEPLDRRWPLLMGVSRRDVAYCIAIAREPDAEHELDDLPDWAVAEALNLSDDDMSQFSCRISEPLYDDERFYDVVGSVYAHRFRRRSG